MILYTGSVDLVMKPTQHTVSLVSAGINDVDHKQEVLTLREHGRKDWSLFYCVEGIMDFDGVKLQPGEFWIYEPEVRQCYLVQHASSRYYYLHFTGSCLHEFMEELKLPLRKPFKASLGFDPSMLQKILELYEANAAPIKIEWRILRLFSALSGNKQGKQERNIFSGLLDEMGHRYFQPFDVRYYASKAGLSVSRFNHLFKETIGESPLHYYTRIRMGNAAHLLRYTDYPVQKIASLVGFEDPLYFDRVFKKWTGSSPKEYRNDTSDE